MNLLEFTFQDLTHYVSVLAFIGAVLIMLYVFFRNLIVILGTVILGIIMSARHGSTSNSDKT